MSENASFVQSENGAFIQSETGARGGGVAIGEGDCYDSNFVRVTDSQDPKIWTETRWTYWVNRTNNNPALRVWTERREIYEAQSDISEGYRYFGNLKFAQLSDAQAQAAILDRQAEGHTFFIYLDYAAFLLSGPLGNDSRNFPAQLFNTLDPNITQLSMYSALQSSLSEIGPGNFPKWGIEFGYTENKAVDQTSVIQLDPTLPGGGDDYLFENTVNDDDYAAISKRIAGSGTSTFSGRLSSAAAAPTIQLTTGGSIPTTGLERFQTSRSSANTAPKPVSFAVTLPNIDELYDWFGVDFTGYTQNVYVPLPGGVYWSYIDIFSFGLYDDDFYFPTGAVNNATDYTLIYVS